MTRPWAAFACIAISAVAAVPVHASRNTPIFAAAYDYRQTVREFEREVLRAPRIKTSAERLVDQLEDSTSRLLTAAHDPLRFDRLIDRFTTTDELHCRVEAVFFSDPIYRPDPQVRQSWSDVLQAYVNLVHEVRVLHELKYPSLPRDSALATDTGGVQLNNYRNRNYSASLQRYQRSAREGTVRGAFQQYPYDGANGGVPYQALPYLEGGNRPPAPGVTGATIERHSLRGRSNSRSMSSRPTYSRRQLSGAVIGAPLQRQ